MSERMKFIGRLLDGEKMTDLCREFEISRVTGYTILKRWENEGLQALNDRSRKPWRLANKTPAKIENRILEIKNKYPTWGAPKILAYMERRDKCLKSPARSTVHAILDRHGLVKKQSRRSKFKAEGTRLRTAVSPNDLWCADFKGQFKMGNGRYCYPLTITDQLSRYLLGCEGLESTKEVSAIETFKRVFEEFGMPMAIRTDNGIPFAARSIFGLSKLSVFWLRLGIEIERIEPGHPQQNGRHERMHKTLKQAVTDPPGKNLLQQQEKLEAFMRIFNQERPHEALKMQCPADVYRRSIKNYPKVIEEYDYSSFELTRRVSTCGSIKLPGGRKIFISDVFAQQELGIAEVDDGIWSVNFMDYLLGYYSSENQMFNPAANPFTKLTDQKV